MLWRRVQIVAELDPELSCNVKLAAANSDLSVSEWIEHALEQMLGRRNIDLRPAERLTVLPPGAKLLGSKNPSTPKGGKLASEIVLEDRRQRMILYFDASVMVKLSVQE